MSDHPDQALDRDGMPLGKRHLDGYGTCDCACWRCWDAAARLCHCRACNRSTCPDDHPAVAR